MNENPSARRGLPSGELLTRGVPKAPQIIKAISTAVAVGCMSGLDGKTLLLQTLHVHALAKGFREIKLG